MFVPLHKLFVKITVRHIRSCLHLFKFIKIVGDDVIVHRKMCNVYNKVMNMYTEIKRYYRLTLSRQLRDRDNIEKKER
jgi:hypothetical protein